MQTLYRSTRDPKGQTITASQAVLQGLSPDGGLYVPTSIPEIDLDLNELKDLSYQDLAYKILRPLFSDYTDEELRSCIDKAYGDQWDTQEIAPVDYHADNAYLELFHGPTIAFKDVALQLLPHLMTVAAKKNGSDKDIVILTATSGDTGKAAMAGFADVPHTQIIVFYPKDGVSAIQEKQMLTQTGKNTHVVGITGNFDVAQTNVKKLFNDKELAKTIAKAGYQFSSANSINIGRLFPQIVYYFKAYADLVRSGRIRVGDKVHFCVPTGNFGDILAGYYAKRMGLPVGKLVCASNENNVLTDFLTTGTYTAKREFFKTTSPSMDILVSSNLERLLYHVTGSDTEVAGLMKSLAENGSYTVRPETLAAIQETFACGWSSEKEVAGEIRARYEQDGYLCDTHTAVAFHVAAQKKRSGVPMVVLSTASPFKFPRSVLEALGRTAPENDFEAMQQLEAATGHAAPASLAALRQKAERFDTVIDPAQIAEVALGYQA